MAQSTSQRVSLMRGPSSRTSLQIRTEPQGDPLQKPLDILGLGLLGLRAHPKL